MKQDIQLTLTADEINIILEGLGNLPFVKVYNIIGKIQEQANGQLNQNGTHLGVKGGTCARHDVEGGFQVSDPNQIVRCFPVTLRRSLATDLFDLH